MTRTKIRPNLLILGASGGVAQAFLHHLPQHREKFANLILIDKNPKVTKNHYLDHKTLKYKFIKLNVTKENVDTKYTTLLKTKKISIVLDLTDWDTELLFHHTNNQRVSYINTALNSEEKPVFNLVSDIGNYPDKILAPHILCSGMNPGVVNSWVAHAIEHHGKPQSILHFEYDTSHPSKQWRPTITWSKHEFIVEAVRDPSGYMLSKNQLKMLYPNGLTHSQPMKKILHPFWKLPNYPLGLTILHEENITCANKYDVPSRFLYAIDQRTVHQLQTKYNKNKNIHIKDLDLGDNTHHVLDGSDNIGVLLTYQDKRIYYFNSMSNVPMIGTNATYTQVIVGVFAALFTIMYDKLKPQKYFVEDLENTNYQRYVFDNLRVQKYIFAAKKDQLLEYIPEIKIKQNKKYPSLFVR